MAKGMRIFLSIIICFFIYIPSSFSQSSSDSTVNESTHRYDPESLVKRLSYENFKHIKMMTAAIINYGGGEETIDKLIDGYAEASALYFQNKYEESADNFLKNEKEIFELSKKIVKKYNEDSEKLLNDSIKSSIKKEIKEALKGDSNNETSVKYLNGARFAVQRGNDIYYRYKDANFASPKELISAIYYYRRAKENIFLLNEYGLNEKAKKEFSEKYKKDIEDNKNKVYKSMVKQN